MKHCLASADCRAAHVSSCLYPMHKLLCYVFDLRYCLHLLLLLHGSTHTVALTKWSRYIPKMKFSSKPVSPSMVLLSWKWQMPANQTMSGRVARFNLKATRKWPNPDAGGDQPDQCSEPWESPAPWNWKTILLKGGIVLPLALIDDIISGTIYVDCFHNPCNFAFPLLEPGENYSFVLDQTGWFDEIETLGMQSKFNKVRARTYTHPGVGNVEMIRPFGCTVIWTPCEELSLNDTATSIVIYYGTSSRDIHKKYSDPKARPTFLPCPTCYYVTISERAYPEKQYSKGSETISFNIRYLLPGTQYYYSFIAIYNNTWAYTVNQSSFVTIPSVPFAPRSLHLVENGTNVKAKWTKPLSNGGDGMGINYLVQYMTHTNNTWHSASTAEDEWRVPSEFLCYDPDCSFNIRVAAVNRLGHGNFSEVSEWKPPIEYSVALASQSRPTYYVIIIVVVVSIVVVILCIITTTCLYRRRKLRLAKLHETKPLILPRDLDVLPRVTLKDISIIKELGEGNFGKVFEGYVCNLSKSAAEAQNGVTVTKTIRAAFKTLHQGATESDRRALIQEALTMRNLNHPNIVMLLGLCVDKQELWLILEMMGDGDLLSYLRAMRPSHVMPSHASLHDLLRIALQIANGCSFLKEMGYVHRDLATRNCLVDGKDPSKCAVKIADFGLTRGVYQKCYYRLTEASLFPVRWAAPEVLRDHVFTKGSDIWSFGITMWEILTLGDHPYNEKSDLEVIHFVRDGGSPDCPEWCPKDLGRMLNRCWMLDYDERISFVDAANVLSSKLDSMPDRLAGMPYMPAGNDAEAFRKLKLKEEEAPLYFDNPLMSSYKPAGQSISTGSDISTDEMRQTFELETRPASEGYVDPKSCAASPPTAYRKLRNQPAHLAAKSTSSNGPEALVG